MIETIRLYFFRDMVEAERTKVYKAFGVLPRDYDQPLNHGIERKLFDAMIENLTGTITRERDEARTLVAEANNSLYGSQGYFHSTNGGPFDKYHLANGIENLKATSRRSRALSKEGEEYARDMIRLANDRAKAEQSCYNTFIDEYQRGISGHPDASAETNKRSMQLYDFTIGAERRRRDFDQEANVITELLAAAGAA